MIYEKILKESQRLEGQIHIIQKQINTLPEGKLICASNGKWHKWYHSTKQGTTYQSEVIIDMFLYKNKIPFRYECPLELDGVILYPDFTIRHPQTGQVYYWEHFGLMESFHPFI